MPNAETAAVQEEPNDVTYAAMEAEDMHGPFDSVADLMDELNA